MLNALLATKIVRREYFEEPCSCSHFVIRARVLHFLQEHTLAIDHRALVREEELCSENLVERIKRLSFILQGECFAPTLFPGVHGIARNTCERRRIVARESLADRVAHDLGALCCEQRGSSAFRLVTHGQPHTHSFVRL